MRIACRLILLASLLGGWASARAETTPPALAATPPTEADLIVVIGRDPRLVLPATLLAARTHPATPLLLVEPGHTEIAAAFVARLAPHRPLVLASSDTSSGETRRLLRALDLPRSALLRAPARTMSARLGRRLPDPPAAEGAGAELFLVEEGDLEAALLATRAAGATGGWLHFLGTEERTLSAEPGLPALPLRAVGRLARRDDLPWPGTPDPAPLGLVGSRAARAEGERRLVLANPDDTRGHFSPPHLSLLAPMVAIEQGAELHLVDARPETIRALAGSRAGVPGPQTVTLVADVLGVGQLEIDDPDDVFKGVQPPRRFALPNLSGLGDRISEDPFLLLPAEVAVGRLAALDVHDLSLQLARQQASRLHRWPGAHTALMLANVDLKFKLGEAISRATVRELRAAGYTVDAHYGPAVEAARKEGLLPGHELVVWEGHPRDLGVDGHLGVRQELLDARLVVLQGCYTLERNDAYILGALGAESVVGTTMPVYSASGSALAKVFLDAQLFFGATQGEALVHARNFTLAYLRLKQKRGAREWRKTWRAGMAFDLWGDPTARPLARLESPETERPPVIRLAREGDTLRFELPPEAHRTIETRRYTVAFHPGGQLGSLVSRKKGVKGAPRKVLEVYFGWVSLPEQSSPPKLRTELADRAWSMVWSPARRRLYLLVHSGARNEPTFHLVH